MQFAAVLSKLAEESSVSALPPHWRRAGSTDMLPQLPLWGLWGTQVLMFVWKVLYPLSHLLKSLEL